MAEEQKPTAKGKTETSSQATPESNVQSLSVGPMGIISLILGIINLPLLCCCPLLALPLGIVAWVLGQLELRSIKNGKTSPSGKGIAMAGMILGIITVVVFALQVLLFIIQVIGGVGGGILDSLPKPRF